MQKSYELEKQGEKFEMIIDTKNGLSIRLNNKMMHCAMYEKDDSIVLDWRHFVLIHLSFGECHQMEKDC